MWDFCLELSDHQHDTLSKTTNRVLSSMSSALNNIFTFLLHYYNSVTYSAGGLVVNRGYHPPSSKCVTKMQADPVPLVKSVVLLLSKFRW